MHKKERIVRRKKIVIVTGNDRVATGIEDDVRLILGDNVNSSAKQSSGGERFAKKYAGDAEAAS